MQRTVSLLLLSLLLVVPAALALVNTKLQPNVLDPYELPGNADFMEIDADAHEQRLQQLQAMEEELLAKSNRYTLKKNVLLDLLDVSFELIGTTGAHKTLLDEAIKYAKLANKPVSLDNDYEHLKPIAKSMEKIRVVYKSIPDKKDKVLQVNGAGPVGLTAAVVGAAEGLKVHLVELRGEANLQHVVNIYDLATQEPGKVEFVVAGVNNANHGAGLKVTFDKYFDKDELWAIGKENKVQYGDYYMASIREIQVHLLFVFLVLKEKNGGSLTVLKPDGFKTMTTRLTAKRGEVKTQLNGLPLTLSDPFDDPCKPGDLKDENLELIRADAHYVIHATTSNFGKAVTSKNNANGEFTLKVRYALKTNEPVQLECKLAKNDLTRDTAIAAEGIFVGGKIQPTVKALSEFWAGKKDLFTFMFIFQMLDGSDDKTCDGWKDEITAKTGTDIPSIRKPGLFAKYFQRVVDGALKPFCQLEVTFNPNYGTEIARFIGNIRFPVLGDANRMAAAVAILAQIAPTAFKTLVAADAALTKENLKSFVDRMAEAKGWCSKYEVTTLKLDGNNYLPLAAFTSKDATDQKTRYHFVVGDALRTPYTFFAMGVNDGHYLAERAIFQIVAGGADQDAISAFLNAHGARAVAFEKTIQVKAYDEFTKVEEDKPNTANEALSTKVAYTKATFTLVHDKATTLIVNSEA